jgi:hypothetical protein
MYNAATSGFVISASLNTPGNGYVVGDVLTLGGGTGIALELTVSMVNASGAILDFHACRAGNYSVYPPTTAATSGGTGSGASFYLDCPSPDYYLDLTSLTSPVLYICTTSGNNSSSVWAKVGGGGGISGIQQFKIVSDGGDYWICNTWDGTTQGTIHQNIIKPELLRAGTNAITSRILLLSTGNVTYSYTFTPYYITGGLSGSGPVAYYIRNVSGSDGSSETEYCLPFPVAGDVVYAEACTTNIITIPTTVLTAAVASGGTGYVSGDVGKVLTAAGGTGTSATLTIASVSGGAVTGITLRTGGNYTANPTLIGNAATGSATGSGATFNLTLASQLIDNNNSERDWCK